MTPLFLGGTLRKMITMPSLNTALANVPSAIRRLFGRKPDLPADPYAYARVRNPRRAGGYNK